jgi:predicted 2-oxoglutarate/Fe(II)-dependent dioxygenase YbiX
MFPNDDYEGGELIVAGNEIHYTAGSAIIFPSTFMFPHEIKPVTKGERWSVISWLM